MPRFPAHAGTQSELRASSRKPQHRIRLRHASLATAITATLLVSAGTPEAVSAAAKATAAKTTKASTAAAAPGDLRSVVEKRLTGLQKAASPELAVGPATCPAAMSKVQVKSSSKASKPVTFRCTIPIEGVPAPYDVEVRDSGYTKGGSFVMSRAAAIIDIAKVVEGTRGQLEAAERPGAKISCGAARVLVSKIGDTITCKVTYAKGGSQTVVYVVRDLDGTISIKV